MPDLSPPLWEITGKFRAESGRLRGTVLRYWTPEAARANRMANQLQGDPELLALLSYDIAAGRLVAATPTSAQIPVAADDPGSVFLAAISYFEVGYKVEGEPGVKVSKLPEGARA